jgi:DNA-binding response OmpR family regulator
LTCPRCGAPDHAYYSRGGLIAHRDPYRVNYRGSRLDLRPAQAELLYQLVRFGRAGMSFLQGPRSYESTRVTVHAIRRRLPPGVEIRALRGWGYELIVGGVEAN